MINISKTDCSYCVEKNENKTYPAYKYITVGMSNIGICKKHLIEMSKVLNKIVKEIEVD